MTRHLLYHIAGGNAFFTGAGLLLAAVLWRAIGCDRLPRVRSLAVIIAMVLILLSSTPLPVVFYAAWACAATLWLGKGRATSSARWRAGSSWLLVFMTIVAVMAEAWTIVRPIPRLPAGRSLAVIGDSLSAAESRNRPNWPEFLADTGITVTNLAQPGSTAGKAIEQAKQVPEHTSAVIIFIGGNDLLGGTSAAGFETRLDQLLAAASQPGRTLYLVELPLIPLSHRFGLAQRRLARRYGAALISKRVVSGVLSRQDAIDDGLHLAEPGSRRMAAAVANQLGVRF